MTMFAKSEGQNNWTGGSGIIPIGDDEAREYAEKYATVEQIEKFFTVQDA